jgi:RHS repeat-associated protein
MKTTRILSLAMTMAMGMIAGLQASVTEHQPPAPLPEFKTSAQLAKWRTETTAKTSAQEASRLSTLDSSTPFYTGKPYLADSGSYAFKYREYNPEMGRWTTVDPSGFPDGANNILYVSNLATIAIDSNGLIKKVLWCVSLPGDSKTSDQWSWTEISNAQSSFRSTLVSADSSSSGGQNPTHYLDDGDWFDFGSVASPPGLSNYSQYDKIFVACHGNVDPSGNLNGEWWSGSQSWNASAFTSKSNVVMVYGCNPSDGFMNTDTLVSKFKDATKNYLKE